MLCEVSRVAEHKLQLHPDLMAVIYACTKEVGVGFRTLSSACLPVGVRVAKSCKAKE